MDYDRYKLQDVAREFARDHGLTLPPGMEKKGSTDKQKQSNLKEKQQQERSGISKEERMAAITAVWYQHNEDPHAFVTALEKAGYHLARSATERYAGDKGRYVVIDLAGAVHPLARQIEDVRTKQIKEFLGADYPLEKLRDIETARAAARQDREAAAKEEAQARQEFREQDAKERRGELGRHHAERRSYFDFKRAELGKRVETERRALLDLQTAEKDGVLEARAAKQPRGMLAFLVRITGIQAYITARHGRQDAARTQAHKAEGEALARRHDRERHDMQRQYANLAAVETRERQSLEIALKRQEFQRVREIIAGSRLLPEWQLKPEFDRAVNPVEARQGGGDSMAAKKAQLLRDFARAADRQKQKTGAGGQAPKGPAFSKADLQRAFELAKDPARKPAATGQQEHTEEIDPQKLEQAREKKDDLEKRQRGHAKDRDPDRER
jgi:hypothetical protein